ncbi:hypothetical protein [Arthrobacter globiformis]|uniref:hypothetical protein n=1 Tax=Arthrobacter globiformis TaxID=1665 RepID=UPI0027D8D878|nr:hypothetical protein [Arthrobacter globiformis]
MLSRRLLSGRLFNRRLLSGRLFNRRLLSGRLLVRRLLVRRLFIATARSLIATARSLIATARSLIATRPLIAAVVVTGTRGLLSTDCQAGVVATGAGHLAGVARTPCVVAGFGKCSRN